MGLLQQRGSDHTPSVELLLQAQVLKRCVVFTDGERKLIKQVGCGVNAGERLEVSLQKGAHSVRHDDPCTAALADGGGLSELGGLITIDTHCLALQILVAFDGPCVCSQASCPKNDLQARKAAAHRSSGEGLRFAGAAAA